MSIHIDGYAYNGYIALCLHWGTKHLKRIAYVLQRDKIAEFLETTYTIFNRIVIQLEMLRVFEWNNSLIDY